MRRTRTTTVSACTMQTPIAGSLFQSERKNGVLLIALSHFVRLLPMSAPDFWMRARSISCEPVRRCRLDRVLTQLPSAVNPMHPTSLLPTSRSNWNFPACFATGSLASVERIALVQFGGTPMGRTKVLGAINMCQRQPYASLHRERV